MYITLNNLNKKTNLIFVQQITLYDILRRWLAYYKYEMGIDFTTLIWSIFQNFQYLYLWIHGSYILFNQVFYHTIV